jgi:hypothetical protein
MKNSFISLNLDFIGFSASVACSIHCIILPLIISMLPVMGIGFLMNPMVEYLVIILGFILAILALFNGYKNHHHNAWPLVAVITGFGIILTGLVLGHGAEMHHVLSFGPIRQSSHTNHFVLVHYITPIGAIIVSIGHYLNWQSIKKSKTNLIICRK